MIDCREKPGAFMRAVICVVYFIQVDDPAYIDHFIRISKLSRYRKELLEWFPQEVIIELRKPYAKAFFTSIIHKPAGSTCYQWTSIEKRRAAINSIESYYRRRPVILSRFIELIKMTI